MKEKCPRCGCAIKFCTCTKLSLKEFYGLQKAEETIRLVFDRYIGLDDEYAWAFLAERHPEIAKELELTPGDFGETYCKCSPESKD